MGVDEAGEEKTAGDVDHLGSDGGESALYPGHLFAVHQHVRPARPAAAKPAVSGPPQPFEPWPQVLEVLKKRDHMLPAYLKGSKAYYDGRRVLIDGGDIFREFIRQNKDSQALLKAIIQEVSGLACGIGPYTPPKDQATDHPTVEQALKDLENHGVDVVYKDKE